MNYTRVVVAAIAARFAFFIYGFLVHGMLIGKDYVPYPEGGTGRVMPLGAMWRSG